MKMLLLCGITNRGSMHALLGILISMPYLVFWLSIGLRGPVQALGVVCKNNIFLVRALS